MPRTEKEVQACCGHDQGDRIDAKASQPIYPVPQGEEDRLCCEEGEKPKKTGCKRRNIFGNPMAYAVALIEEESKDKRHGE